MFPSTWLKALLKTRFLSPGGMSRSPPFSLPVDPRQVEERGAGLLIFFLLVLGFLKPKEEEEERIWNDVGILSFSSFMEAQCQPGRGFKLRAKWLPAWLSKQHPVLPLPQLAVNTNPVVSAEDREPPASTPDKKSAFLSWLPTCSHQWLPVFFFFLQLCIGLNVEFYSLMVLFLQELA